MALSRRDRQRIREIEERLDEEEPELRRFLTEFEAPDLQEPETEPLPPWLVASICVTFAMLVLVLVTVLTAGAGSEPGTSRSPASTPPSTAVEEPAAPGNNPQAPARW